MKARHEVVGCLKASIDSELQRWRRKAATGNRNFREVPGLCKISPKTIAGGGYDDGKYIVKAKR